MAAFTPMTLALALTKVGATVRYHPPGDGSTAPVETGRIIRVSGDYVMVLYRNDHGAKATRPGDLELVS